MMADHFRDYSSQSSNLILVIKIYRLAHLKVLVRQVNLQTERVHPLRQRPGQQLSQREGVLTEAC